VLNTSKKSHPVMDGILISRNRTVAVSFSDRPYWIFISSKATSGSVNKLTWASLKNLRIEYSQMRLLVRLSSTTIKCLGCPMLGCGFIIRQLYFKFSTEIRSAFHFYFSTQNFHLGFPHE